MSESWKEETKWILSEFMHWVVLFDAEVCSWHLYLINGLAIRIQTPQANTAASFVKPWKKCCQVHWPLSNLEEFDFIFDIFLLWP